MNDYQTARRDEADRVFDFRHTNRKVTNKNSTIHNSRNTANVVVWETHTNKPLVWVIPNLLTREEYQDVLQQLQDQEELATFSFGKDMPQELCVKNWWFDGIHDDEPDENLSKALLPRIRHGFCQLKEQCRDYFRGAITENNDETDNIKEIHSVNPNWKVLKLQVGEEFPAHQDAMDSMHDPNRGVFAVSTHSILLDFQEETKREESTEGHNDNTAEMSTENNSGAIRFYYRQYPFDGPYDYCVDVHVPPGWAIIMEQRVDLVYAIQPFHQSSNDNKHYSVEQQSPCRYVAQAGILKELAPGQTVESLRRGCGGATTFSLGPGLMTLFEAEAEICNGEDAPRGWGQHSFNPKAIMWKDGRPLLYADASAILHQSKRLSLPGLERERRWSMIQQPTIDESIREKTRRRRNSIQCQVDPLRKRVSYVASPPPEKRNHAKDLRRQRRHQCHKKHMMSDNMDDSVTSATADFSESFRSLDDESFIFQGTFSNFQQQPQQRRRSSIQVTRKPREDSIVGQLVQVFQATPSSSS